jgi:predicted NBD/HSP70 family sugar kinase
MGNTANEKKERKLIRAYELLCRKRRMSLGEIAKRLEVTEPTALKIMDYLLEKEVAKDLGLVQREEGTKAVREFAIVPEAAHVIAALYEGSVLSVGIVNLAGELLIEESEEVSGDIRELLVVKPGEIAWRLIGKLPRQGKKVDRLLGYGMCLPGVVNHESKEISFAPGLDIEEPYDLCPLLDELSTLSNVPVYIENDVNAAAYGEAVFRGCSDMAFIAIGSNVGMGLLLDGKLRFGSTYTSGEVGMIPYDVFQLDDRKEEAITVEKLIGLEALKKRYNYAHWHEITELSERRQAEMMDFVAKITAQVIISTAAIVDVRNFALGGILVDMLSDRLIERIEDRVKKYAPFDVQVQKQKCVNPALNGIAQKVIEHELRTILLSERDFDEERTKSYHYWRR